MAALVPGFSILQHLGRGAGSHIYRAKDLVTGKEVAVKRVIRRSAEDDKYLAQTEHEYAIARRFSHRHLRRCLEIRRVLEGEAIRELLLVMELVPGHTLERRRPRRPLEAIDAFLGIARGLEALHAMGLVHCDVKPRNVILALNGEAKIIDFGQTCPIGTAKERVQGTPDFLAPEQVRLDPLDERTDVFGLGATMYWALTGYGLVTPMPSSTPDPWPSVNGRFLRWSGPATPAELNGEIPAPLSDLVMRACEERAPARPAGMQELIEAFNEIRRTCFSNARAPEPCTDGPDPATNDAEPSADGSSSLARSS